MSGRRRIILVSSLGAAVLAVCVGVLLLRRLASNLIPRETTEVADYDATLHEWADSGLVAHFPPHIPAAARNVRFVSFPGALQGGAYLQLRMQLPAEDVKAIRNQLALRATRCYEGGDMFDHYNRDPRREVPTADFRSSDDPQTGGIFPTHFKLYVLSAKDRSGGSWNHGDTSGAAVSTDTNEVVYWAESW